MADLHVVPTGKSDLEYLFDLLSLIPIPTMNRNVDGAYPEWWQRVAATEREFRDEETPRCGGWWRRRKPTPVDRHDRDKSAAGYITSSLAAGFHGSHSSRSLTPRRTRSAT
ncbi:hypothetical protein [Actinopolymorpha rutila]|uniref:Uncharacterized protein n=1 Tax=Actinopolymorpha rutila TaxID=446787 RepID=A0A852ZL46_9ACTN|nr:hypothetical protein [Actinopolymorpha rutila]NYH92943.1 hypothetical protein [Actinopolymorpha rutila]